MSSEDSEEEDTLVVRPIPQLSKKVKTMLDEQRSKDMTAQSRRQAQKKVRGASSTRLRPSGGSGWIFKKDIHQLYNNCNDLFSSSSAYIGVCMHIIVQTKSSIIYKFNCYSIALYACARQIRSLNLSLVRGDQSQLYHIASTVVLYIGIMKFWGVWPEIITPKPAWYLLYNQQLIITIP